MSLINTSDIHSKIFDDFKVSINQKINKNNYILEGLLIQQQSDVLSQISRMVAQKNNSILSETTDNSTQLFQGLSRISSCKTLDFSHDEFGKKTEEQSVSEALYQIKRYCSRKTFQSVRQFLSRVDMGRIQSKLKSSLRHNEQLMCRIKKMTQEKICLQNKINELEKQPRVRREVRKMSCSQMNIDLQRQQQYLNIEKSIIYKQKMLGEKKKKIQFDIQTLEKIEQKNNQNVIQIRNFLKDVPISSVQNNCYSSQTNILQNIQQNLLMQQQQMKQRQKASQQYCAAIQNYTQKFKKQLRI